MKYYKLMNRKDIYDYGDINIDDIKYVTYSLDNSTLVLSTKTNYRETENLKEISETEFDELKQMFNNERSTIATYKPISYAEQLESENALLALELVDTQIRLDQTEQEQAALLLELVDRGVI